jgi:hypothetical protein
MSAPYFTVISSTFSDADDLDAFLYFAALGNMDAYGRRSE